MARRSLKPQLNQIRTWVRQGRTDAWIAHQLEVTVQQVVAFKEENTLVIDAETAEGQPPADPTEELDLRAEDDALIAQQLEEAEEETRRAAAEAARASDDGDDDDNDGESDDDEADRPRRRRSRRGGRNRRRRLPASYEATFDHGEEGYGLWLDPTVTDDPIYAEHWAGQREIEVTVEADQIIIRRTDRSGDSPEDDG